MSSSDSNDSALDSSFRLELIPLPAWSSSNCNGQNKRLAPTFLVDEAQRKLPMMAAIAKELRRTDNILVTEIGERGLLEYLQEGLRMNSSCNFDDGDDCRADKDGLQEDDEGYQQPCHWEFQDNTSSFRYLMEILQANMIYFLKRRYFDLERCRERGHECPHPHHQHQHGKRRSSSIAEDFQTIFDKASSSRFLTNREHIAMTCFRRHYQRKGSSQKFQHQGLHPKTIKTALVRLHRRAGIYLPQSVGTFQHPSPANYKALQDGVDAYWIDLWWVCSSLLTWILEPCLQIVTSSLDDDGPSHPKRRRLSKQAQAQDDDDPAAFWQQSQRVAKIPFALIRAETQKLGLFYDRVLLHDGPWEEEIDETFVSHYNDNSKRVKGDGDGDGDSDDDSDNDDDDDSDDEYNDDCDDVGHAGCEDAVNGSVTNVLGEKNDFSKKGTAIKNAVTNDRNQGEGEGNGAKGKEFTMNLFTHDQNQGEEKGNGEKRKRNPSNTVSTETNGDGNRKEINIDNAMAIYNAFWQQQDENFESFCDKIRVVGV